MTYYERPIGIPIAVVALCALATTGCRHQTSTAYAPTAYPPTDYPTFTTLPGVGVGAQTGAGAAADVPEATQQGAGASNLTPGASATSHQAGVTYGSAQAQASAAGQGGVAASETAGAGAGTNVAIPLYQESLQVGTRDVNDGSIRIRKYTTTETVNQPLALTKQTVTIDRVASGDQAAQSAPGKVFQDQDVDIQLHHQEPIISKQVVIGGQVVARIQTEVQHTNVQGQIRREQVQVTKQGDLQNVAIAKDLANPSVSPQAVGGGGEVGGQGQATGAGGPPITDASTLTGSSDPGSLVGRQVNLSNLKVQEVIGDHFVVLNDSAGKPLYARVAQGAAELKPGDQVNLTGTVNRLPATTANLGLSSEASQTLQSQPIYLDVPQLQPTSH